MIWFKFGVDWVRDRIEARWPESERARMASGWIGLLAPVALNVVLVVVGWALVSWLRIKSQALHL